jgi:ABC-2 type transport system permease protein
MTALPGAVRGEWIKLRSLRSTYLTLLGAVALAIAVGVVDSAAPITQDFDPVGTPLDGFQFAQLAFGVFGVLAVSSDYATGMIRSTLVAVPRRTTVAWAKVLVASATAFVLGQASVLIAFLLGQAALSSRYLQVSLFSPGVLRALFSAGLYLVVVTLVGFGLGALLRHSAGAIAGMFAVVFLSWPVARALEGWSYLPDRLLLPNAAVVLAQLHAPTVHSLRVPSLGVAYADLALYVVVALGLGIWRMTRDA